MSTRRQSLGNFPSLTSGPAFRSAVREFFVSLTIEGKILGSLETLSKERTEVMVGMGREEMDDLPWLIRRLAVAER